MIIILGASGFIGGSLYKYFIDQEVDVVGTYNNNNKPNLINFDVEKQRINEVLELKNCSYAIICLAIPGIDYVKKHYGESYNVNVVMTKRLIKDLFDNGVIPLFISTEYIFDGRKGNYKENDKKNPETAYGKQKMEVEDYIFESKKRYVVLRLSKIYGLSKDDNTMLTDWAKRLRNDETVSCINDQVFSPTYMGDIVRAIHTIINRNMTGLYHVANPRCYDRVAMAIKLKEILSINSGRIESKSCESFGFIEPKPLNASFNSGKFIRETGFEFTKLEDNIRRLK